MRYGCSARQTSPTFRPLNTHNTLKREWCSLSEVQWISEVITGGPGTPMLNVEHSIALFTPRVFSYPPGWPFVPGEPLPCVETKFHPPNSTAQRDSIYLWPSIARITLSRITAGDKRMSLEITLTGSPRGPRSPFGPRSPVTNNGVSRFPLN